MTATAQRRQYQSRLHELCGLLVQADGEEFARLAAEMNATLDQFDSFDRSMRYEHLIEEPTI